MNVKSTPIRSEGKKVGIVGLGYVGLPLAVEFCKHDFDVYGVDKSSEKIELSKKE